MAKKRKSKPQLSPKPAALEMQPLELDRKWVLLGLAAVYLLTVAWGLIAQAPWDDDCLARYYNVRNAFNEPTTFISLWNRPLFTFLFVLTLQFGKHIIVFQMAVFAVLTYFALYKAAKTFKMPNAYLIIPFTAFQTFFFPISYSALAEPLAACIIALGFLFYSRKQFLAFTLIGSLLPLARLELSPLLAFWALVLILEKQWKFIPLFVGPTLLWNFGGTYFRGDPIWLYSITLGKETVENKYGHTTFWHYFQRYNYVIGPVIFYYFMLGLFEKIYRRKPDWFVTLQFAAGFMIYVVFSWKLNLGHAAGFLRHLVALSPLAAILALQGFNLWIDVIADKKQKMRILIYSIVIIILTLLFFSKKLFWHHSITEDPEYVKLSIISLLTAVFAIGAYLGPTLFIKKQVRLGVTVMVVGLTIAYTLITEPPNKNFMPERQTMVKVSEWYVKNKLQNTKTYVNHTWFFYGQDLDKFDDNFAHVTQENLNKAEPGSIVIWESHYSHRLFGDVQLSYFENNPNFKEILRHRTSDNRFAVVVFQKV